MRIGIDIDNVIAHTFRDLVSHFNQFVGRDSSPDEVVRIMKEDKLRMVGYWFTTWRKRLLTTVAPIDEAVTTLKLWHPFHDLVLITSRMPIFKRQTRQWLAEHGVPYHELHHAKEKTKYRKAKGCQYFIEDNLEESAILAKSCERVFLMDHPWNRRPLQAPNIIRVHNWHEIRSYLDQ